MKLFKLKRHSLKGGDLSMNVTLYKHQSEALIATKDKNRVAYYHDMGL